MIVLVFPGVRLLDVTGPIEVFASANEFRGRYRAQLASEDRAEVVASAGTRLSADLRVDKVRESCDVPVTPGGPDGGDADQGRRPPGCRPTAE